MAITIIFLLLGMAFGVLVSFGYRLVPLLSKQTTLAFSPNSLRMGEVVVAIAAMIIKSVIYAIPGVPRANAVRLQLNSPFAVTAEDVARFHLAVGNEGSATSDLGHLQLIMFLSAMTESAMLLLLASPRCPINPLGAVNVRNEFELIRPELCELAELMNAYSAKLEAVVHQEPRVVKRGIEWDLEVRINLATDKDDQSVIFRQIFTMLEFRKIRSSQISTPSRCSDADNLASKPTHKSTQISLSGEDPLRWAALCKDYNFIHLSRVAAKFFGLPGKLAHGNHASAKALWSLENTEFSMPPGDKPLKMQVEFKRPMVVPGVFDVELREPDHTGTEFLILRKGKVHAAGRYS
ncbi:ricin b lectin [Stemphylium lycopersici]|uniref:Ricin b lectin n=1 Tax=Stemphylium lycopersici TaxID=183478 RepID=A0A364MTH3_STELY|nr:ricin b lectin [Stemphylium lycopersici]RAQ99067.1 ricin b lectin [Stemphylium lycopersici]RAR03102.1 ricin b lectin [Stemphylium lycopersici]